MADKGISPDEDAQQPIKKKFLKDMENKKVALKKKGSGWADFKQQLAWDHPWLVPSKSKQRVTWQGVPQDQG